MMKNLIFCLFLTLQVILIACSKGENLQDMPNPIATKTIRPTVQNLTNEELKHLILFENENVYSEPQILEIASELPQRATGRSASLPAAFGAVYPVIKQILTVPVLALERSTSGQTKPPKIYILGYQERGGFSVIVDDKRVSSQVLMYSVEGDGNLPLDQPGFRYVVDILKSFVVNRIAAVEAMRGDSVCRSLAGRYEVSPDLGSPGCYVLTDKLSGDQLMVTETQVNRAVFSDTVIRAKAGRPFTGPHWTAPIIPETWGQKAPFNIKAPNGYAGCVATAVGMILHYKYSHYTSEGQHTVEGVTPVIADRYQWRSYSNTSYGWPADVNDPLCQDVGRLIYDINSEQNLASVYSYDGNGTLASIEDCSRTFRNMGTTASNCEEYNAEALYSNNGDVSVIGGWTPGSALGHAWVIDSMARVNGVLVAHCNWGYNGSGNGMCNAAALQFGGVQYSRNLKMVRSIGFFRRR